jgi:hypothetical protein
VEPAALTVPRVHLLGVAEHGGRLLDHLETGIKHNETSHFTELLEPLDPAGAVGHLPYTLEHWPGLTTRSGERCFP